MKKTLLLMVLLSLPVGAQDAVSLKDAVHLALEKNKSVEASTAARNVAERRVAQAKAGNLPKVNYSESWTRSDNPVFVFGSLLTQHQ
jgi:outer membrane protein TolC